MLDILKRDKGAKFISDAFRSHGYRAYLVGGCVRDVCMHFIPYDIDIAVSATPDIASKILESVGCRVIPTGLKHGTVTAIYDDVQYEITTMRKETGYSDRRHPELVEFVCDIESDLSRRDFTINAMAYSYETDSIVDLYGGREDIKNKLIRCVGEPRIRFGEDALRILRALRFASRLGFDIEERTLAAMREAKESILCLSVERVYRELCGILCGKCAGDVLLKYADILYPVIPELEKCVGFKQHSKYHVYDVLEHICKVIDATAPATVMRLAALFHDIGKPSVFFVGEDGQGHFLGHAKVSCEIAEEALNRLKADNKTKENVLFLVKHHDMLLSFDPAQIKKRINRMGADKFLMLCDIAYADCMGKSEYQRDRLAIIQKIKAEAQRIISEGDCTGIKSLAVSGEDIMALGIPEGKEVGRILKVLLDEVLSEKLQNSKEALLSRAIEIKGNDL